MSTSSWIRWGGALRRKVSAGDWGQDMSTKTKGVPAVMAEDFDQKYVGIVAAIIGGVVLSLGLIGLMLLFYITTDIGLGFVVVARVLFAEIAGSIGCQTAATRGMSSGAVMQRTWRVECQGLHNLPARPSSSELQRRPCPRSRHARSSAVRGSIVQHLRAARWTGSKSSGSPPTPLPTLAVPEEVAHWSPTTPREANRDRRSDDAPCPLGRLPAGRSGGAESAVRQDLAPNRRPKPLRQHAG